SRRYSALPLRDTPPRNQPHRHHLQVRGRQVRMARPLYGPQPGAAVSAAPGGGTADTGARPHHYAHGRAPAEEMGGAAAKGCGPDTAPPEHGGGADTTPGTAGGTEPATEADKRPGAPDI